MRPCLYVGASYLQDVNCLDLVNVVILCVRVDLEHAVDEGQFAEGPQVQLLIALLVLQSSQALAQLIQGADGCDCCSRLTQGEAIL